MRGFSIALIASFLVAGPVLAASPMGQLKDVDGKVYVNRGKGFVLAKGNTELFQGDRVMVGEKSSASINYYLADCDVMLTSSSMTTVSAKPPCKGGGATTSTYGQTVGEEVTLTGGAIVAGGGVIAAGVGGVLATTGSDENDDNDLGQSP
jgi:hypothetical protein